MASRMVSSRRITVVTLPLACNGHNTVAPTPQAFPFANVPVSSGPITRPIASLRPASN
jgi:hypothetical protein